jgi:hypothetical protein
LKAMSTPQRSGAVRIAAQKIATSIR